MSVKKAAERPAMTHVNVKMLATLVDAMKTIRYARCVEEGQDVKLQRLYREAVEMYINAEPQARLLAASRKSLKVAG